MTAACLYGALTAAAAATERDVTVTLLGPPEAIRRHLAERVPILGDVHAVGDTAWELLGAGLLSLPLPGEGQTIVRWRGLAEVAAVDLAVGQLVEGHLEAAAVHADAGRPLGEGLWALWSATSPDTRIVAEPNGTGWLLNGTKRWCTGARSVTGAVLTARDDAGVRTFAVAVREASLRFTPESSPAVGMAFADSLVMHANGVEVPGQAELGDGPNWYFERPSYWAGMALSAATWYGGALGIARTLRHTVQLRGESDPFALAQLGFVDAACEAMDALLERTANVVDMGIPHATRTAAWRCRAMVEHLANEVLRHAGQALGAAGLSDDPGLARRVADLTVLLRHHGAEREYTALGADVLDHDRLR